MPYTPEDRREKYDEELSALIERLQELDEPLTPGDLNHIFTKIVLDVVDLRDQPQYAKINNIIGLLECCKLELYRKVAAPYEDIKEAENGPV